MAGAASDASFGDPAPQARWACKLRRLYDHLELPRDIVIDPGEQPRGESVLRTEELADHDDAIITVVRAGGDLLDAIADAQGQLEGAGRKAIYLDLSLADPATATLPETVHDDLGFFFGAVVPERSRGDILRMQSLHDADVQPGDVTTASEYGAQLLGYIFECKRSAAHHGVVP